MFMQGGGGMAPIILAGGHPREGGPRHRHQSVGSLAGWDDLRNESFLVKVPPRSSLFAQTNYA